MILGKLIRTSITALAALAAISVTQANAAEIYSGGGYKDIPAPPCCSFAGFYVGGNMGMAWSEVDRNGGTFNDHNLKEGEWGDWSHNTPFSGDQINSVNGFGGGQFGYNFQNSCCWLYGIEVDLGALALNNNFHRFANVNDWRVNGVEFDGNKNNDALFAGDVTARLGYTFSNSLVYVKGGFAFVDLNDDLRETIFWRHSPTGNLSDTFGSNNNSNFITGWTIGAGYEWKPCCQSNWSIKVEYLHYDFGNIDINCCNDTFDNRFRFNNNVTADTVKIGFNYFWNNPVAPLK